MHKHAFLLGLLAVMLGFFAANTGNIPSARAANGDNLASFDAAVTAGIPACDTGTGLAYDTTTDSLVLSCWGSNVLERVDAVTHLNDGPVAIAGLPNGNDLQALAYDGGRDRVWACNAHGNVVLLDLTTGTVDLSIPPFPVPSCTDGLAYDGSDDTIWVSPDVSGTIYHYDLSGFLLGSFPVGGLIGGSCGNSGIAVGGAKLYLANNGCSEIYEVEKDGSASSLFASFPARIEDLECDNETFAGLGLGAIWSQDAYDRILNAWEIPADQCASGGGVIESNIELTPTDATNEVGTEHTVTATVSAGEDALEGVLVSFSVASGPNAGEVSDPNTGECAANDDCTTDSNGQVSWTYTGAFATGQDVIVACFVDANSEAGQEYCVTVVKDWIDTELPSGQCVETTNPSGKNVPKSGPNAGKSGQNPDGFYQLIADDNVEVVSIVVRDSGSAFVSDPFADGDKVKITQAPGVTPSDSRPGPGVITSHLKLKGDAILLVTDSSGNKFEVACLVPPPPK